MSFVAAASTVILSAWSLWLASAQSWNPVTAWMSAMEPESPPAELLPEDDDEIVRLASDDSPEDEQVHRAIHVTMTSVTEEKDAIQPVQFQEPQRSRTTKTSPQESRADVWLTGAIEDSDDAAELQESTVPAIPAWKRRSQPLKAATGASPAAAHSDR